MSWVHVTTVSKWTSVDGKTAISGMVCGGFYVLERVCSVIKSHFHRELLSYWRTMNTYIAAQWYLLIQNYTSNKWRNLPIFEDMFANCYHSNKTFHWHQAIVSDLKVKSRPCIWKVSFQYFIHRYRLRQRSASMTEFEEERSLLFWWVSRRTIIAQVI